MTALLRTTFNFAVALIFASMLSLPAVAEANKNADEMAGAVLFRDKGCAHCHGDGGIGGKKGPPLVDIQKDKQWTPEKMTNQILNGGQKMPPFADSLTDAEVAQLVAYLRDKHRPVLPPAPPPA